MFWNILNLIVALLISETYGVIYYLNESEYNRMPPIYKLDDYEVCLRQPRAVYCSVHFNLVSDVESELLDMIKEYSEQTRTHYNHSQLMYGICFNERCQKYIKDSKLVAETSLEACLNETFMKEYQLKTQVTTHSCHSSTDEREDIDNADKAVAVILLAILMINILGSIYDLRCGPKMKENNVLVCFSIRRNWKRLISYTTNSDPRIECLKGLNGIRCIVLFGVVMVHSSWPFLCAVKNTHDLELMYYNVRRSVFMSGSLVIQTNILLSGFLLAYNTQLYSENNEIDRYIIPRAFLSRYFRITPAYAVVIALSATWLKFLGPGPLWEGTRSMLYLHCKNDWWRNLLFINNYNYNSQCLLPSWYLSMDMQLFCLGIILCVLLVRQSWRKPVLSITLILGILIMAFHTYIRDLDPILIVSPGATRTLFESDPTFNETYKMSHTNIPSFIIGMMLGYSVYRWHETGVDISRNKTMRYSFWALLPAGLAVMFSGELFYRDAPRDPLAVRVAYAAVAKPLFAALVAMLVAGIIFKIENVYRKVLEWEKWRIPSRLSYCVFVVNHVVIHAYVGLSQSLFVVSNINLLLCGLAVILVSFVTAVPLWLLVESPFTNVFKYYSSRWTHKKNKNNCKKFISR